MPEPMIRCPVCDGTTPASWRHGFGADQVYVCRECGEPIGEGRLKVMPFATRCVACQASLETMHRAA